MKRKIACKACGERAATNVLLGRHYQENPTHSPKYKGARRPVLIPSSDIFDRLEDLRSDLDVAIAAEVVAIRTAEEQVKTHMERKNQLLQIREQLRVETAVAA